MAGETVRTMNSGVVIPRQSIYEESSTAKHALGDKCMVGERVFHYCKNGSVALADGKIVQSSAPVANYLNKPVAANVSVGATRVSFTPGATACTANQFANGYLHCNDVAPEGTIYKIKSHLACAGSVAMWVELYDPVWKAMTTSSEVTLTKSPWDEVIIAPNGGLTAPIVGVPLIDVTASYYFWAQTWGPAPVLTQGTIVIGQPVGLGGTADGAIGPMAADTTDVVGVTMQVNASTEYSLIFLKIAP